MMDTTQTYKQNRQAGNILIYILGAIFLLGVLIVTVRGSGTSNNGITEESLLIKVAEVQQYGAELENAVTFIMRNGFSEADIRFAHPDADAAYGVITDNPARQIFSKQGGGATYREPPSGVQSTPTAWNFNGSGQVLDVGSDGAPGDISAIDLVAWLPYVTEEFCIAINDSVGIENVGGVPPQDIGSIAITPIFTGSFISGNQVNAPAFRGKQQGCMEGDATPPSGTYHYYRVLLAR